VKSRVKMAEFRTRMRYARARDPKVAVPEVAEEVAEVVEVAEEVAVAGVVDLRARARSNARATETAATSIKDLLRSDICIN